MEAKMIWANFAVQDLERTTKFYTQLGFKSNGRSAELTSFLVGDHNFVLHFFIREQLEKFMPVLPDLSQGNEIMFSLSAKSEEEVDAWAENVKKAGGTITREPAKYELGYTCCFADPDGHRFNVLYWPGM